jgi:diadenosine tetraphosphate (Ap4A) HIT family hydrolase
MCVFCDLYAKRDRLLYENELVFAIADHYPVSQGHTLVIPKRHFVTYFEATPQEYAAMGEALRTMKADLDEKYHPDGYNIGVNNGEFAGQTVMHLHVHLIPRYHGDSDRPRGGVRGVIPGKQNY